MPNKPVNKSLKRQLYVKSALASAHIEGFIPSKDLTKDLWDYIQGHATIEELIKRANGRHETNP